MKNMVQLIVLIIGCFVYFSNPAIGFLIILFSLISILANKLAKQEEEKKKQDYKIEEGVVIESTKQLPYKIPSKMEIIYRPSEKQAKPKWAKATSKGLIPFLTKKATDWLKKL